MTHSQPPAGVLLVNKPVGITSFKLIAWLRRLLSVKKIGHAGTLDPFASGVMLIMVGKDYTRLSDKLMSSDKEYRVLVHLGRESDTHDCLGEITEINGIIPSLEEINETLSTFQGWQEQIPPMFSAKKIGGKKLYELARKGIEIERKPAKVKMEIELISYQYPFLELQVACSKGTYIRALARDIGEKLRCGALLDALQRTRSGIFTLSECIDGALLQNGEMDVAALTASMLTLDSERLQFIET